MIDSRPGEDQFLRDIEAFLLEMSMTPTAFGQEAFGDPAFVFRVRNGRDCRRSTLSRAREQMTHYRKHGEFLRRPARRRSPSPEEAA